MVPMLCLPAAYYGAKIDLNANTMPAHFELSDSWGQVDFPQIVRAVTFIFAMVKY